MGALFLLAAAIFFSSFPAQAQTSPFRLRIDDHGIIQITALTPSASHEESFISMHKIVGAMAVWQFPVERLLHIFLHLPNPPKELNVQKFNDYITSSAFSHPGLIPLNLRLVSNEGYLDRESTGGYTYYDIQDFLNRYEIEKRAAASRAEFDPRAIRVLENWLQGFKTVIRAHQGYFHSTYAKLFETGIFQAALQLTTQDLIEVSLSDSDLYYTDEVRRGFETLRRSGWLGSSLAPSATNISKSLAIGSLKLDEKFPGMSNAFALGPEFFKEENFATVSGGGHLPSLEGSSLTDKFKLQFVELHTSTTDGEQQRVLLAYYGGTPGAAPHQVSFYHGTAFTADPISRSQLFLAEVRGNQFKNEEGKWTSFELVSYQTLRPGGTKKRTFRKAPHLGTQIGEATDPMTGKRYAILQRLQQSIAKAQNGLIMRAIYGLNGDGPAYERLIKRGDLPHWGETGYYSVRDSSSTSFQRFSYGALNQGRQNAMATKSDNLFFHTPSRETITRGEHEAPTCLRQPFAVSHNGSLEHFGEGCAELDSTLPSYMNPMRGMRGLTTRQDVATAQARRWMNEGKRLTLEELIDFATDTYSRPIHRAVQVATALFDVWGRQSLSPERHRRALYIVNILRGYDGRVRDDQQTLVANLLYDKLREVSDSQRKPLTLSIMKFLDSSLLTPEDLAQQLTRQDGRTLASLLVELERELDNNCHQNGKVTWSDASVIKHFGIPTGPSMIATQSAQLGGIYSRSPERCSYELLSHSPFYYIGTPTAAYINTLGSQLSTANSQYLPILQKWVERWNSMNADNSGYGRANGFLKISLRPGDEQTWRSFWYDQVIDL
ncbi:MAG: hypothetical protein KDD70_02035 [Bdellovibrionales bacterium]|nr:hypothetical protein [Bdellovibrionales bacterium]